MSIKTFCVASIAMGLSILAILFNDKPKAPETVVEEPKIGAAYSDWDSNIKSSSEPIRFGALVGSATKARKITLTPHGELFTEGKITSQSQYSYIGDFNRENFSGQSHYVISPGRLKLENLQVRTGDKIKIELPVGILGTDNAELTDLKIAIGSETVGFMPLEIRPVNGIVFEAISNYDSYRSIDLLYGGTLFLPAGISGKIDYQLDVEISRL